MVQLLLIGRHAPQWAQRMSQRAGGEHLEIHQARLPAEGVRRLEQTPPDVVILIDEAHGTRARAIVQAIRQKPLGQILPVLIICDVPTTASSEAFAAELGVEAWLPPDSPIHTVLAELARILGLEIGDLQPPLPHAPTRQEHESFVVEDISSERQAFTDHAGDEEAPSISDRPTLPAVPATEAPEPLDESLSTSGVVGFEPPVYPVERVDRQSLFPVRTKRAGTPKMNEDVIRRKLREVRHEDYFTILETRLGSEGPVLRQAYQKLMATFDPEQMPFEMAHRFFPELEEIRDALEDAWAVLGDAYLRQRYIDAHMGRLDFSRDS